jgi:hypothetical protein
MVVFISLAYGKLYSHYVPLEKRSGPDIQKCKKDCHKLLPIEDKKPLMWAIRSRCKRIDFCRPL